MSEIKPTITEAAYMLVSQFKSQAASEGVVMDHKSRYLGAFVGGALVGFVGLMDIGKSKRFKSDWVMPHWRGKGIYSALFSARFQSLKAAGYRGDITAYCTSMSLPTYLKNGFKEVKKLERGSTIVSIII